MSSNFLRIPLIAANILLPAAIWIFATGFFPYKPFLSGLAQYEVLEYGPPPEAPFDKLVFMVVDALRSDFVYSENSGFKFTQSLISNGAAIPFTAYATSPTITMPRIKAITTGSTPSFLDVILNFAESDTSSTLSSQDTWLAQMKAKDRGKLVMYGDDTWLKLFPETFDRSEGTSSFFVSDFTEVDNNVTRHVPDELKRDDWNTLVLHYLGLDHIGHKTGPRGPNMIPKQEEMDGIVRQIYEAIEKESFLESTLLVLAGDHGMNDAGNHGGSAAGETSPALVFISPKLKSINSGAQSPAPLQDDFRYHTFVEQSDIAPTLGALLGFPVPRNNLGAVIPNFLDLWPRSDDKVQILWRNARQMLNVLLATFPSFEQNVSSQDCDRLSQDIDVLACKWKEVSEKLSSLSSEEDAEVWKLSISKWLKEAQELMSGTASNYDVSKLVTGQGLAGIALVLALLAAWEPLTQSLWTSFPFVGITLLYGSTMTSSSYVEEEHHFWYWVSTAWLTLLLIKSHRERKGVSLLSISSIGMLTTVRLARRWNQTGQKWAGAPDIARTFFKEHTMTLWSSVLFTYVWSLVSFSNRGFPRTMAAALATAAFMFKLAFTSEDSPELLSGLVVEIAAANSELGLTLVAQARIVFIGLATAVAYVITFARPGPGRLEGTMRTIHSLLFLFLTVQSRAANIPLLLIFEFLFIFVSKLDLNLVEITTTSILLQYTSFFAFGGSNAISSIDLASGYNGVSGYNVLAVGILTFVSNWTGPIFWTSATMILLQRLRLSSKIVQNGGRSLFGEHIALMTVFTTSSLLFVMAACTVLRTHLFIWTVFSPKYLYSMAWTLGQHLAINVGFGRLLWWLGNEK